MTKQEMLASVEAQIRKDIPRTMEFREGCLIKEIKTGLIYKILNISDDGYLVTLQRLKGGRIENIAITTFENISEIIGHDIMLNDVLEWFILNEISIIPQCSKSESIMMLFYIEYDEWGNFYHYNVPWNLSSPHLKDQSEEMINFLYNLKKD